MERYTNDVTRTPDDEKGKEVEAFWSKVDRVIVGNGIYTLAYRAATESRSSASSSSPSTSGRTAADFTSLASSLTYPIELHGI